MRLRPYSAAANARACTSEFWPRRVSWSEIMDDAATSTAMITMAPSAMNIANPSRLRRRRPTRRMRADMEDLSSESLDAVANADREAERITALLRRGLGAGGAQQRSRRRAYADADTRYRVERSQHGNARPVAFSKDEEQPRRKCVRSARLHRAGEHLAIATVARCSGRDEVWVTRLKADVPVVVRGQIGAVAHLTRETDRRSDHYARLNRSFVQLDPVAPRAGVGGFRESP